MAVDRRGLPPAGAAAPLRFPAIERDTLSNGVRFWAVDHHEKDLVSLALLVPSGSAADPPGYEGLAAFTADLLDDGTQRRSGIDLHEELGRIGGRLGTDVTSDATVLSITALARHARDALALLIELATEPRFDPREVERVRALRISRIAQTRHVAAAVAQRAFLRSVYGTGPYGHVSAGTETALARTTVDDVRAFHAARYAPRRWTLIASGGGRAAQAEDLMSLVTGVSAAAFSAGRDPESPDGRAAPVESPPGGRLTFVPRAGAVQSEIRIGHLGVVRRAADYPAIMVMNMVLGGQFVSRLNLNLREAKGYTYGIRTAFDGRRGRGPFTLQTAVDAAVTGDAIREAVREIREIRDARPVTEDELAERETLAKQREDVLVYLAYKEAVKRDMADHDRDGVISKRDELVSEDMRNALLDMEAMAQLKQDWEAAVEPGSEVEVTDDLVREYGRLFGETDVLDPTVDEDAEMLEARADAELQALPRWPPLIPVTVVEPMAGALHGFITGHRQGDVCRIAVHDPFTAEIIGFQYRDDRRINQDLRGALSGLVVEHNFADAWSGMVFRRTEDLTTDTSSDDSAESDGVADSIE